MDLSDNLYFFRQHMNNASYHASVVAYFGSEDAINAGTHLMWFENVEERHYYDEDYDSHHFSYEINFQLRTPDGQYYYDTIYEAGFEGERARQRAETIAKNQQLSIFRNSLEALEALSQTNGLLYHIEIGIPQISIPDIPDGILSHVSDMFKAAQGGYNGNVNVVISEVDTEEYRRIMTDMGYELSEEMHIAVYSNVDPYRQHSLEDNVTFFKNQTIYFIVDGASRIEQSNNTDFAIPASRFNDYLYTWPSQLFNLGSVLLAFPDFFVTSQFQYYSTVRDAYIVDISIIAACIVLILALTVILLIGAGRQYVMIDGKKERPVKVHFSPLDKPYLDISLALIICWLIFIMYLSLVFASGVWYHKNITFLNIIIGIATLLTVPPVLYWLMTLVKRLKAGRFWKHTLIYAIIYSFIFGSLRFILRKIKSLWSGTRLSIKITIISLISFFMMCIIGVIGAAARNLFVIIFFAALFAFVITFFLMLYARRIRNLETGAKAASEGDYETPINAGGGELGNIANSLNSISSGINTAVEERMKSERLKTELITNVSHDIRTPLTSIITYTDLLQHEGLDCEKAPDYLEILKQKSLRLKTLTDELFEAAKASTGNIDVNLTDLNMVSLINQVLGELDSSVKSSGIDLRVNLQEKLIARADGRLMQRVMENLLSNVFKYSLPGSRVYLDAYLADNYSVRIDLKNISATELNFDPSELTERFKRGDDSRADGGSGLGLSIVQSFMGAQGGRFEISIDGDLFKATVILPIPPQMPE